MPRTSEDDRLADRHYVVAIVRLLLNQRGELVQGEVHDAENLPRGRFRDWPGLIRVFESWLGKGRQGTQHGRGSRD